MKTRLPRFAYFSWDLLRNAKFIAFPVVDSIITKRLKLPTNLPSNLSAENYYQLLEER